jgi:transcriptional regulator GlxA family with amidase domain
MTNSPLFPPSRPRIIEILAFPDVQLLDVAGPLQVFASANDLARGAGLPPPYHVTMVAREPLIATTSGLALAAAGLPLPDEELDTLIIPGGRGIDAACVDPALLAWVRVRVGQARRVASVCSGAFLLATLGLLDGRRAVTHWNRCGEFARRFPEVHLDPAPIFIQDGGIWTSAGITAGIDLALAFVEADLGGAAALAVARQLVVFLKRPGGQAQFSAALSLQQGEGRFERLHAWIAERPASDLSVPALAAFVGMSERSFVRAYHRATGSTPAKAVERLRVEAARRMLEESRPVKQTAAQCGFGSEETMRRAFLRLLGSTPAAYRERFSAALTQEASAL